MNTRTDLSDQQWERIKRHIPISAPSGTHRGRPKASDRECLNGILWILRTGAAWRDLPGRYPSKATCHRRFQQWAKDGTFKKLHEVLLSELDKKRKLSWNETFIDGMFASAKKGAFSPMPTGKEALDRVFWPLWMLEAVL
jgi:transposase